MQASGTMGIVQGVLRDLPDVLDPQPWDQAEGFKPCWLLRLVHLQKHGSLHLVMALPNISDKALTNAVLTDQQPFLKPS